jgi:SOS-response transcriptional repressor LexA
MNWTIFISHLLKEFRLSSYQLQKQFNINSAIISNLRSGRTKSPNEETIRLLEASLGIRIDDSDIENITYTKVNELGDVKVDKEPYKVEPKRQWPMVVGFIPASTNGSVTTYYEESIEEKPLDYDPNEYFWLRIDLLNGESMLPMICPGDFVLIGKYETIRDGDLVFVQFKDEQGSKGAIKQYSTASFDHSIGIFTSYNSSHQPLAKKKVDCRIYKVKLVEKR